MRAFSTCRICGERIELIERKDFESFTEIELWRHVEQRHPAEMTKVGMPFHPVEFEDAD